MLDEGEHDAVDGPERGDLDEGVLLHLAVGDRAVLGEPARGRVEVVDLEGEHRRVAVARVRLAVDPRLPGGQLQRQAEILFVRQLRQRLALEQHPQPHAHPVKRSRCRHVPREDRHPAEHCPSDRHSNSGRHLLN